MEFQSDKKASLINKQLLIYSFILLIRRNIPLFNFIKKVPQLRYRFIKLLSKWVDLNLKNEVQIKIDEGIKMFLTLRDNVQRHLFIYGYYEPAEAGFWKNLVKNKKTIFDIGTNVGYFSLLASQRISQKNGKVFAFEPVLHTYNRAKYNIELNSFTNIFLNKIALSDKKGTLEINIGNEYNWGMSSVNKHDHLSGKVEIVETDTVDNFILKNQITELNAVKIDIEGSEFFALKGMSVTLLKLRPTILIEILEQNLRKTNATSEELFDYLWKLDYIAYKILNSTELKVLPSPVSYDGLICFHPREKAFDDFVSIVTN
jgi:FkbM family methyltransferase